MRIQIRERTGSVYDHHKTLCKDCIVSSCSDTAPGEGFHQNCGGIVIYRSRRTDPSRIHLHHLHNLHQRLEPAVCTCPD